MPILQRAKEESLFVGLCDSNKKLVYLRPAESNVDEFDNGLTFFKSNSVLLHANPKSCVTLSLSMMGAYAAVMAGVKLLANRDAGRLDELYPTKTLRCTNIQLDL